MTPTTPVAATDHDRLVSIERRIYRYIAARQQVTDGDITTSDLREYHSARSAIVGSDQAEEDLRWLVMMAHRGLGS